MQVVEDIKDYIGETKLERLIQRTKSRTVSFCNLNDAESVGIIVKLKNAAEYKKLLQFVELLKAEFGIKTIRTIAYYKHKESPEFLSEEVPINYFLATDVNWRRIPRNEVCSKFINEKFDIIIDLTKDFSLPLRYLLLITKSKFKVGRYSEKNKRYYDFMISLQDETFEEYTQELVRYLASINAKK